MKRFNETIGEQEETLRIKWNKHVNGKMKPAPSSLEIRADFNDRLHAGDVPDLVGYEQYLNSIHHNLQMYITGEAHNLKVVEGKYFDHLTDKAGEQKPMIELLDEYIASLPPDENRHTGEEVFNALEYLE